MTLATAVAGKAYKIKALNLLSEAQLRLMELGFKRGEIVALMQRTALRDLLKVCVKGTRFAIRARDAACIEVEPADESGSRNRG